MTGPERGASRVRTPSTVVVVTPSASVVAVGAVVVSMSISVLPQPFARAILRWRSNSSSWSPDPR